LSGAKNSGGETVRILGPLEVVDDAGEPVVVGRGREGALLCLLLVSANQVVSVERLTTELWPGDVAETSARSQKVEPLPVGSNTIGVALANRPRKRPFRGVPCHPLVTGSGNTGW
jgi:hypothetical protein